jgi:type I site-specific restriction endonuclease
MENLVYTFKLNLDWKLVSLISQIDRFDASWTSIEKKEGQSLKQLKSIATVRSVGASTRIEGSKMSDEEVEVLLKQIDITKLSDRDSQEVVGYFEALDIITESYENIEIKESNIKNLHNILFVSGGKSFIRIVQGIGRGLRLHENKEKLVIIDIYDNLKYSEDHALERKSIYIDEEIPWNDKDIIL